MGGDGLVAAGTKLLLDQTVWAFIWLSIYYGVLGALNFDSPSKIVKTFKASFLPVCLVGWRFWPFVHIVTYGLIPPRRLPGAWRSRGRSASRPRTFALPRTSSSPRRRPSQRRRERRTHHHHRHRHRHRHHHHCNLHTLSFQ